MKSFIKIVIGACIGTFLAFLLMFIFGISLASVFGGKKEVTQEVIKLNISGDIPDLTDNVSSSSISGVLNKSYGLDYYLKMIAHAKDNSKIKGIYLQPSMIQMGYPSIANLRDALLEFRAAGKFVVSYSSFYTQKDYYLASVSDSIYMNPSGNMMFNGYGVEYTYYKGLLDKLGVEMQVFHVGDYKSATEPYRMKKMTPENREQIRVLLEEQYEILINDISEQRDIVPDSLKNIADQYLVRSPNDAVLLKMVDALYYEDQVLSDIRTRINIGDEDELKFTSATTYESELESSISLTTKPNTIAVIYAEGDIVPGKGTLGQVGSDTYVNIIRDIRKDENIEAIVLRVNSPGGSALASENIWRELKLAKEVDSLPIIVSMGDVAASGGYYIAMPADTIYAEENTITGSIGVFALIPNAEDFFKDKLGLTFDTVTVTKYGNGISLNRRVNIEERAIIQTSIEDMYAQFKDRVEDGRDMTDEAVEASAQGRVWTGESAKERGLVDKIGSLEDAVNSAANSLAISDYNIKTYPTQEDKTTRLISLFTGEELKLMSKMMENELLDSEYIQYIEDINRVKEMKGIQMRMPDINPY